MSTNDNTNAAAYLNEEFGLQIGIEEMQKNLEAQFDGIDALKEIARTLFGSSSLIAGLFGVLQISNVRIADAYLPYYVIAFAVTILSYLVTVVCSITVLTPVTLRRPVVDDWGQIYKYFTNKTKVDILRTHLAAYIKTIKTNETILARRRKIINIASIAVAAVVIMILMMSLIPRFTT